MRRFLKWHRTRRQMPLANHRSKDTGIPDCGISKPRPGATYALGGRGAYAIRALRDLFILALGPAVFDRHTTSLDVASFLQATAERSQDIRIRLRQCAAEKPDHRYRRLLRARRERPRSDRAAEQCDELAPPHGLPSGRGSHPTIL